MLFSLLIFHLRIYGCDAREVDSPICTVALRSDDPGGDSDQFISCGCAMMTVPLRNWQRCIP